MPLPRPRLSGFTGRRLLIVLFSVSLLGNLAALAESQRLLSSEWAELNPDPAAAQLRATGDAVSRQPGFAATVEHETLFVGPLVPAPQINRYEIRYRAPDALLVTIGYPMTNSSTGETRTFHYQSLTLNDLFYVARLDEEAGWRAWATPLNEGMDLVSARTLGTFLRHAHDATTRREVVEGRELILVEATGDARDLPGVIYHNYAYATLLPVPFDVWIDPATNLPAQLTTWPTQMPVLPSQNLRHRFTFTFSAWDGTGIPEPAPLLPPEEPPQPQG